MIKLIRALQLMKTPKIFYRKIVHQLPLKGIRQKLLCFPGYDEISIQIENMLSRTKKRPIVIFPGPSCPWGYMFQRPQQLARALAKQGYTVIYLVNTDFVFSPDWDVRGLFEIEEGLYLYNDNVNGLMLRHGLVSHKVLIWQYWPHQRKFIEENLIRLDSIKIYDCIDHLSTFDSYSGIQEDFEVSLSEADIVITTASGIQEEIALIRPDSLLIPNGVDIDDFKDIIKVDLPELDQIKESSSFIVGYYGAIAEWFDFESLDYMAKKNHKWTFVIVGEIYTEVLNQVRSLKKNSNVIFIPRLPYKLIPQVLCLFDIAILPFLINKITLNTSPVKVYEYLAGGKIVVSSDLPEVRKLDTVLIAKNALEFHNKLHEAVSLKDRADVKENIIKEAIENTWTKRVTDVLKRLEGYYDK